MLEKFQVNSSSSGVPIMHRQELLYICSRFIGPFLVLAGDQQYLSCSVFRGLGLTRGTTPHGS